MSDKNIDIDEEPALLMIKKGSVYEITQKESDSFFEQWVYRVSWYNDKIIIYDFDKNSIKPMVDYLLRWETEKESSLMLIIGSILFVWLLLFWVYYLISWNTQKKSLPDAEKINIEVSKTLDFKEKQIEELQKELKIKKENNINKDVLNTVSGVENENINLLNTIDNLKFSLENQKNNFDFRFENFKLEKQNLSLKLKNCNFDLVDKEKYFKNIEKKVFDLKKNIDLINKENKRIINDKEKIKNKLYHLELNTKGSITNLEKYFWKIVTKKCLKSKKNTCLDLFDKFYNEK